MKKRLRHNRRVIGKQNELLHFLLRGKKCYFCKKLLIEAARTFDGDGRAPMIKEVITIHHRDGNHDNDGPGNGRLCHQTCHKRYNCIWVMKKYRAEQKRKAVKG